MRALLHAHSTYSYDGRSSLPELADWGAARGLDFILLSEHTNDFDAAKMDRLVGEIASLGARRCQLVPGLEFPVRGGFHLLGLNVREFAPVIEPLEAVRFIRQQGGLAVLAHPARYGGRWPEDEALREMHGIEAWNARYDGRFLPSGDVLRSASAVAARLPGLRLFGGQDLHEVSSHRLVTTEVAAPARLETLLSALAAGGAVFGARGVRFAAVPGPAPLSIAFLKFGHRSYRLARRLRPQHRS